MTGSSDNYIRVYQVYPDGPEKIVELPNHAVRTFSSGFAGVNT